MSAPLRSIRLVRVQVPLVTAHRAAHGTEHRRDVVLVNVTRTDGTEGWGECPTLSDAGYSTETTDVAWRALVGHLAPAALGLGPTEDAESTLVAAPAALADARLDAALRAEGRSLRSEVGGARSTLGRCAAIAALGEAPAEVADRARRAVGDGAEMVKVKIAPGHDGDVLAAVRSAVGSVPVAADANGVYDDPSQLAEVDALGLRYLEQPFAATVPLDELVRLHGRLRTPVALDESLGSPDAVRRALELGAVAVVSVKPARLGGALAAAEALQAARQAGVDAFVGGMLELGIGRAVACAVATSDACTLPTDLGPSSRYVSRDVCEPIVVDESGRLVPPDGPGIGRIPDDDVLAEVTVDERLLHAPD